MWRRKVLSGPSRRGLIFLAVAALMHTMVLVLTNAGLHASFDCSHSDGEAGLLSCLQLRAVASCEAFSGPVMANVQVSLLGTGTSSASAFAKVRTVCPWDRGTAELRVLMALASLMCLAAGAAALRTPVNNFE